MGLGISNTQGLTARLHVNLFGVFNYLDSQQKQFSFKSRKTAAVLLALCLSGQKGMYREELAFLIWPDLTEERAKAGLRRALSRIRAISKLSLYKPSSGWVALDPKFVSCDLWNLERAIVENKDNSDTLSWPTETFLVSYPKPTDIFSEWINKKIDSIKNTLKLSLLDLISNNELTGLDQKTAAQFLLLLYPLDPVVNDRILHYLRRNQDLKLFDFVYKTFQRRIESRGDSSALREISDENRALFESLLKSADQEPSTQHSHGSRIETNPTQHGKPILVVENFRFVGNNNDVRYLGEAVAEELLLRLSRQNWFDVQFIGLPGTYKPKGVKDHALNLLCNSYKISGTVLADKDTARISVRLSDESTGLVYWSEQYDNDMANILTIHTKIIAQISELLSSKLIAVEAENITQNASYDDSEINLDAWVNTMRARNLFWRTSKSNNLKAKELLEPVVQSKHPPIPALVTAAFTRLVDAWSLWTENPEQDLEEARRIAERAVQIDQSDPWTYFTLGTCLGARGELNSAIHTFNRSLELNPNFSASIGARGKYKIFNGNIDEGIADLTVALSMNDLDPHYGLWQQAYGIAKFLQEEFDEALVWCERAISTNSYWYHNYILSAAILSRQGKLHLGRKEYSKVLKFLPYINSINWFYGHPFKNRKNKEKMISALSVYGFK